jgi:hypothetical protein
VCELCAKFRVDLWPRTSSRAHNRIKGKERGYWCAETSRHALQLFKGRCVSTALNQAEKIDRHPCHLGKLLLSLAHFGTKLPNSHSKLLAQVAQYVSCTMAQVWRNLIPGTTE